MLKPATLVLVNGPEAVIGGLETEAWTSEDALQPESLELTEAGLHFPDRSLDLAELAGKLLSEARLRPLLTPSLSVSPLLTPLD